MKRHASKGKGNAFEWEVAKALSLWITAGKDKTQLIRSVQSGGAANLQVDGLKAQVGDLAPNGPAGVVFRDIFGVECKHYAGEPDWWGIWNTMWEPRGWWVKHTRECENADLSPFLVMKRNRKKIVVAVSSRFDSVMVPRPRLIIPEWEASIYTFSEVIETPWEVMYQAMAHRDVVVSL